MGVYIKGMEMPKNCGECKFFAWKRGVGQHCAVDDRITFHATIDGMDVAYERSGNCPLVPVPPHGRLGDLDALKVKAIERSEKCGVCVNVLDKVITAYDIETAPTIIPADPAEEGE